MTSVSVPLDALVSATRTLRHCGRPDLALRLLPTTTCDPHVAVARVEVESAQVYLSRSGDSADRRFAAARSVVEAAGNVALQWELGLLEARNEFYRMLFAPGTQLASMDGRDPDEVDDLRRRLEELESEAPDAGRAGWPVFLLGTVHDNLYGRRELAPPLYERALSAALDAQDDYLAYEALRHLGDHAHDIGNAELARSQWEDAAAHAARAGSVVGVLNQQILLAQLARERGEENAAVLLAREVGRWADVVGAARLYADAEAFLSGGDPTSG